MDKAKCWLLIDRPLPGSSRTKAYSPAEAWTDPATAIREAGDLAFAMMALALARLSVHEANVATEESIQYVRSRFEARYPGSALKL